MTRSRRAVLTASAGLAAALVGVRVFWRAVSGDVSGPSLLAAAVDALPFAALILGCGVASAVINLPRLLLRPRRSTLGRSLQSALGIGWLSVTELASEAQAVRRALRLRGIRRSVRALTPVLEHAIERAIAVAGTLALTPPSTPTRPASKHPAVHFDSVSLSYDERKILHRVSLDLEPGLTVLTGPTGGGKTSLIELISGLAEHLHCGRRVGTLTVLGVDRSVSIAHTSASIGMLAQQPRLGMLDEQQAVLSAGEVVQAALARAIAHRPSMLLLDEPFADLDQEARVALCTTITDFVERGAIVVVAEHHTDELEALHPRWLQVVDGTVTSGRWQPPSPRVVRTLGPSGHETAVRIDAPLVSYRGVSNRLTVCAALRSGEAVAILGPNGSGKTSLLEALANPRPGEVMVQGVDVGTRHRDAPTVALVPDDVRRLFVCETLEEELRLADRVARQSLGATESSFRALLHTSTVDHLLSTHPRDLSAGTQRALALAMQLSRRPGLLLVDEPTRGLDPDARGDAAEQLSCVAETGAVVLFATQDQSFASSVAHRVWHLRDGALVAPSEVPS